MSWQKSPMVCLDYASHSRHLVLAKDDLSSFVNGHSRVPQKNRADYSKNDKKIDDCRKGDAGRSLHAIEFMVECLLLILKSITYAKVKRHNL